MEINNSSSEHNKNINIITRLPTQILHEIASLINNDFISLLPRTCKAINNQLKTNGIISSFISHKDISKRLLSLTQLSTLGRDDIGSDDDGKDKKDDDKNISVINNDSRSDDGKDEKDDEKNINEINNEKGNDEKGNDGKDNDDENINVINEDDKEDNDGENINAINDNRDINNTSTGVFSFFNKYNTKSNIAKDIKKLEEIETMITSNLIRNNFPLLFSELESLITDIIFPRESSDNRRPNCNPLLKSKFQHVLNVAIDKAQENKLYSLLALIHYRLGLHYVWYLPTDQLDKSIEQYNKSISYSDAPACYLARAECYSDQR